MVGAQLSLKQYRQLSNVDSPPNVNRAGTLAQLQTYVVPEPK